MIKKATILGLAAFYLLLTSGMFVCAVHCTAEALLVKPARQMGGMVMQHSKNCMNGNNCDCCKKHGSFIVKENLRPGYTVAFDQTVLHFPQVRLSEFNHSPIINTSFLGHYGKAPPGISGRALAIKYRSLLI